MTETRNRFYKARRRAKVLLSSCGYHVQIFSDGPFDIEASREFEFLKIKICLDTATKTDKETLVGIVLPAFCQKEIWLKKSGTPGFEIIKIPNPVNRKSFPV